VIENIANIYFDFNPPVITEPSVLVAEFSTGVDEARDSALSVYPNPATATIAVVGEDLASVRIISLEGRVLHQERVEAAPHRMDVHFLAAGTYFMECLHSNGQRAVTQFTKH
jgi:hypothetical protein